MKTSLFSIVSLGILLSSSVIWRQLRPAEASGFTLRRAAPTFTTEPGDLELSPAALVPEGLPTAEDPGSGGRGVIGPDDRTAVRKRAYPWTAVGRLNGVSQSGSRYHCTATLIDVDRILTNAHCVVDPNTNQAAVDLVFSPNVIDGTVSSPVDRATVIGGTIGTDFQDRNTAPHEDDWAILQLNKPLGEQFGTIPLKVVETETLTEDAYRDQLIMVGYSGDYPTERPGQTAAAHMGCSITAEAQDVIYHICDTYGGSSGGPLLAKDGDSYSIVGLNSAGRIDREERGIVNYGVKISRIVDHLDEQIR